MKPKYYPAAIMLCTSFLYGIHSSQARSVLSLPILSQPQITDFNSLYTGSFVATTNCIHKPANIISGSALLKLFNSSGVKFQKQ